MCIPKGLVNICILNLYIKSFHLCVWDDHDITEILLKVALNQMRWYRTFFNISFSPTMIFMIQIKFVHEYKLKVSAKLSMKNILGYYINVSVWKLKKLHKCFFNNLPSDLSLKSTLSECPKVKNEIKRVQDIKFCSPKNEKCMLGQSLVVSKVITPCCHFITESRWTSHGVAELTNQN